MTTPVYVRNSDGSDANSGGAWPTNHKATLAGGAGVDEAGGLIYVAASHAESSGSAQTIPLAGTGSAPVKVLCVDDTGDPNPPTAAATTATVTTTTTAAITITGHGVVDGIAFSAGTGGTQSNINLTGGTGHEAQLYRNCSFTLGGSHASALILIGTSTNNVNQFIRWWKTNAKFNNAGQLFSLNGRFEWHGGAVNVGGGTSPTTLFNPSTNFGGLEVRGVDFSNLSTTFNFFGTTHGHGGRALFHGCKLPASWTGKPIAEAVARHGLRVKMVACDSGDTNYKLWIKDYSGDIRDAYVDASPVTRTGGASDGTTAMAWKMSASANCSEVFPLYTDWMEVWIPTTGVAKTLTCSFCHDSPNALKDSEIWMEALSFNTSGVPLFSVNEDRRDNFIVAAADQATDNGSTWANTGGFSTLQKQKVNFSVTNQELGYAMVRVGLAVANETVYLDPKIVLS